MLPSVGWIFHTKRDPTSLGDGLGRHSERQTGQTNETVIIRPFEITDNLEALIPGKEFFEHHPDLKPRKVGPQTEVGAKPKTNMKIRIPTDVEPERVGKLVFISVGRHLPYRDLLPLADALPAECVTHGCTCPTAARRVLSERATR